MSQHRWRPLDERVVQKRKTTGIDLEPYTQVLMLVTILGFHSWFLTYSGVLFVTSILGDRVPGHVEVIWEWSPLQLQQLPCEFLGVVFWGKGYQKTTHISPRYLVFLVQAWVTSCHGNSQPSYLGVITLMPYLLGLSILIFHGFWSPRVGGPM